MQQAEYQQDELYIEEVSARELAGKYSTPLYVYSQAQLLDNYRRIQEAFAQNNVLICYALKANANPEILRLLAERGAGADVVSLGELQLALRAGIPPEKIVFAGVGKRDDEIVAAMDAGILGLNVESEMELAVINELAAQLAKQAPVSLRVNPDIDIHGHPYISTGRHQDKFGMEIGIIEKLLHALQENPHCRLVGLHAHLGSQIREIAPYRKLSRVMRELYEKAQACGHVLEFIDIGGGLGIDYQRVLRLEENGQGMDAFAMQPQKVAEAVLADLKDVPVTIIFEPGRALTANAGLLLTRVLYLKHTGGKTFVIVDAGMSDLLRPSLYQAYHEIVPARLRAGAATEVDVVGPICESGDFFARERSLPPVQRGDTLAVMTAGAYGFTLASNYNARPRPAEVLVSGNRHRVIRPRESLEKLY